MSEENVEAAQRSLAAFNRRDQAAWLAVLWSRFAWSGSPTARKPWGPPDFRSRAVTTGSKSPALRAAPGKAPTGVEPVPGLGD